MRLYFVFGLCKMTVPRMITTKPNTVQVSINLKTNKATVKQVRGKGARAAGVKKGRTKGSDAQFDAMLRKKMAAKRKKTPAKKRIAPTMSSPPRSNFKARMASGMTPGNQRMANTVAGMERRAIKAAAAANRKKFAKKTLRKQK